ncbi:MAG TPA: hypothetical protein VJN94_04675 [Candidatus Binataceae bacterium]|nr:hypothetical protein [Candidatus Binataceae bacterium]
MNTIERMVRTWVPIAAVAMTAAIFSSSAIAQDVGPVGEPSEAQAAKPAKVTVPALGPFSARGSSANAAFAVGNCGTDIICSGSSCACNTASGSGTASVLGKVQYNIEVLSDADTDLANGERNVGTLMFSDCTGGQGLITLTSGANSVKMDTAGLVCFTVHDQVVYSGTYTVTSGVGKFATAFGGGSASWTFTTPAAGGTDNELYLTGTFAK